MLNCTLSAQSNQKANPLYAFMQANADTTIVFEYISSWIGPPEAYFISKKGDTLNCYTYKDPVYLKDDNHPIPAKIRTAMKEVSGKKILFKPMDIDEFFKVSLIDKLTLQRMWNLVNREKPWTLVDDEIEGTGCGIDSTNTPSILDGGGINLHLITKAGIKKLYFDAPDFYDKHCKGRRSRTSILKIESLVKKYIQ
jgi:hypothetical protein